MSAGRDGYQAGSKGAHPAAEPSLSEVVWQALEFLRRNLALIGILGLAFAVLALIATQRMERLYSSAAQIMIDRPAVSPIEAEAGVVARADLGYVDGQILLITSDDTLAQVVERAGLTDEPFFESDPPNPVMAAVRGTVKALLGSSRAPAELPEGGYDRDTIRVVNALKDILSVTREGDTNVVRISVRANSPALAQRIAAGVAETYVDLRVDQRRREAGELSDWIDERARELRDRLTAAERDVSAYRIENNLMVEGRGASLSDQQLMELNGELIRSQTDLAQKRASLERARAVLDENGDLQSLPEVQNSEIITALRQDLLNIELRDQALTQDGSANNSRLTQVRRQRDAVLAQIQGEVERIEKVLANEVETLESRTRLLAEALARATGQSGVETQSAIELRELERIAEAYRLRYERYLNNAGLASELGSYATSGTQMIRSATLPLQPVYPPVRVYVVLAFLLGSALGVGVALIRETAPRREADAPEAFALDRDRELEVRVLAHLPELDDDVEVARHVTKEPFSAFSEAIAVVRYALRAKMRRRGQRGAPVVVVSSAGPGEGKTTLASALAISASTGNANVLLIDGDLKRAGLSEQFDMLDGIGLADILKGALWQVPQVRGKSVLDVLPIGGRKGLPRNGMDSPHLSAFVELARRSYDLIVIDGPSMASGPEAGILADHADHVIFALRTDVTPRDQATDALSRLPAEKVLGVVLNFSEVGARAPSLSVHDRPALARNPAARLFQLRNAGSRLQSVNQTGRGKSA
jgi:uncharacterized protein involved in exopolysaccharide biosynthesis/Mrp family chromosome partitioning ATPase